MAGNRKQFLISSVGQALLLLLWFLLPSLQLLSRFVSYQLDAGVVALGQTIGSKHGVAESEDFVGVAKARKDPDAASSSRPSIGGGKWDDVQARDDLPRNCKGESSSGGRNVLRNRPCTPPITDSTVEAPLPSVSIASMRASSSRNVENVTMSSSTLTTSLASYRQRTKFYAVAEGFNVGIFTFWWGGGHPQTNRARPSTHQGFSYLDLTESWLRNSCHFTGHIHFWEYCGKDTQNHSMFTCITCGDQFTRKTCCCDRCDPR